MKIGKFQIEPFIFYILLFVLLILGTSYLTQLPELKSYELKIQESKEQELKHQVELEELKLKILEENK